MEREFHEFAHSYIKKKKEKRKKEKTVSFVYATLDGLMVMQSNQGSTGSRQSGVLLYHLEQRLVLSAWWSRAAEY